MQTVTSILIVININLLWKSTQTEAPLQLIKIWKTSCQLQSQQCREAQLISVKMQRTIKHWLLIQTINTKSSILQIIKEKVYWREPILIMAMV